MDRAAIAEGAAKTGRTARMDRAVITDRKG